LRKKEKKGENIFSLGQEKRRPSIKIHFGKKGKRKKKRYLMPVKSGNIKQPLLRRKKREKKKKGGGNTAEV